MSSYRVFETEEFTKKIKKLDRRDSAIVQKKFSNYVYPQISKEPHFGKNIKKLKGYEPATWRYRIGKFRVFYTIDEDESVIYLLTLDYRKDAY